MPQTFTAIMAILKAKFEAMVDGDDEPLFDAVYDYKENSFTGYPVAVIAEKASEGTVIDNHRNERDFIFEVRLYQEIGERSKSEAAAIMRTCVDVVLQSFDEDINLSGEVARVRVIPVEYDFTVQETPHNFATFLIRAVDLVNNFPS